MASISELSFIFDWDRLDEPEEASKKGLYDIFFRNEYTFSLLLLFYQP